MEKSIGGFMSQIVGSLLSAQSRKTGRIPTNSHLWLKIVQLIQERDQWKCQDCGSRKQLDVHHTVSLKSGGTNLARNLRTLCRRCHRLRHGESRKVKFVSS